MLKCGEKVSSKGTCNLKYLEIFWDVLKIFLGDEKAPIWIIVRDCAMDWPMNCLWHMNNLPTVFEEGMLLEVCVCCRNELCLFFLQLVFELWKP